MEMSSSRKRSSTLKACDRCHRRKQRCVGLPACVNCQRANATCMRDNNPTVRRFAKLSRQQLIDKLEALLPVEGGSDEPEEQEELSYSSPSPGAYEVLAHQEESSVAEHGISHVRESLESPSIAIETIATPYDDATHSRDVTRESIQTPRQHLDIDGAEAHEASPPDNALGAQLLSAYLENMHRRMPFFDFSEVVKIHARRFDDLTRDACSRRQAFRLYMVYATGAAILRLTDSYNATPPGHYLAKALLYRTLWKGDDPIRDIEAMILIVNYKLRTSLSSRLWYMIGLAMRTAVEAGMHREYYYRNLDPEVALSRRRVFWSVFVLERSIGSSLKRPLSISERDIDIVPGAEFDFDMPDSLSSFQVADTVSPDGITPLGSLCTLSGSDYRLSRILSRIYAETSRVDRSLYDRMQDVPSHLAQLKDHETTLSQAPVRDQNWLYMHYHDAVRKTIEPFLSILQPQEELMKLCLQASGRECQLFKTMHVHKRSAYSFLMINSVFTAGMTICYILFRSPALWTPSVANDLRACSSTLFVMAASNANLQKYRDILEQIINTTMEHISQASNPGSCSCANCKSLSHDDGTEDSPSAFHQLRPTFRRLNFEFPSQAYPDYTTHGARCDNRNRENNNAASTAADIGRPFSQPDINNNGNFIRLATPHLADDRPTSQETFMYYPAESTYPQDPTIFAFPDLWDLTTMEDTSVGLSMMGNQFIQYDVYGASSV